MTDQDRAWKATQIAYVKRLTGRKFPSDPPPGFDPVAIAQSVPLPEPAPQPPRFVSTWQNPNPAYHNHVKAFDMLKQEFNAVWMRGTLGVKK